MTMFELFISFLAALQVDRFIQQAIAKHQMKNVKVVHLQASDEFAKELQKRVNKEDDKNVK